ncbi:MAG: hypothetical protein LC687_07350, partial [Actinobacteria bacterium]|nr:hypothetical protein [Actinomycetota bacterium]
TQLAREVVSVDTASSTGELHFKADSISSTTDTSFYIYYGNPNADDYAVNATYGRNDVWSDYAYVTHADSLPLVDSSGNISNATASGTPVISTGKTGNAVSFDQDVAENITFPNPVSGQHDIIEIQFQAYPTADISKTRYVSEGDWDGISITNAFGGHRVYTSGAGADNESHSSTQIRELNTWQLMHHRYDANDSTNKMHIWKNGGEVIYGDTTINTRGSRTSEIQIADGGSFYDNYQC